MSLPIRARLTVWLVAMLAILLVALGGFLVVRSREGLVAGLDESLSTRASQIALGLRHGCEGEFRDLNNTALTGLPQGESGAQLLGPGGSLQETSGDALGSAPLLSPEQVTAVRGGQTLRMTAPVGADAESFRMLAVASPTACEGAIVVATSTGQIDRSIRELLIQLAIGGPVVLVIAGVGTWLLARRALEPVGRMTREAGAIGIDRIDERIDVPPTSDEVQRLALTLNEMLDRLEDGVEDKRRFVADASHELRTPLAVMQAELDVDLRATDLTPEARTALESVREEVARMTSIVDDLLTLARVDAGSLELLRTPVDLAELAGGVADKSDVLARTKHVRIDHDGSHADVLGDHDRLEQVLTNLVSNAIRHAPDGGSVQLHTWTRNGAAGCSVTDDGPGVAPEIADHVFDRFVRGDPARASGAGSGLGLSICREIVEAHGGRIWVDMGPGGSFSFSLPRAGAGSPTR
jgi:two-component system OmpR family sensor kinase